MKKLKNEAELVREALRVGAIYIKKRGIGELERNDSAKDKVEFVYRALVHDRLIQPLAKGQTNDPAMKHKLAMWIARQLPADHPLLK